MALTFRQGQIIDYLTQKKHAKISEISKHIAASDATVRRELTELKKLGLIERDHGGAVILESADEISIFVRQKLGTNDKEETSRIANMKLPDFKTVFIDNSSTALIYTQRLNFAHKTVVTNGIVLAMQLARKKDVFVLMPGGSLAYNTNSLTGYNAIKAIDQLHFNLMICSCTSINENGVFESSLDQCEIKRTALKNSSYKVLLVDKTKFNDNSMYRTCSLSDFDAIYTNALDATVAPLRRLEGVKIINKA
ncbi:MAG: DeoR/GlpR transcriptional regulator [Clostridia bacterium]|nr:DeoR/GlpR transcriptional regulator [Clostridia bacterium]